MFVCRKSDIHNRGQIAGGPFYSWVFKYFLNFSIIANIGEFSNKRKSVGFVDEIEDHQDFRATMRKDFCFLKFWLRPRGGFNAPEPLLRDSERTFHFFQRVTEIYDKRDDHIIKPF
jgi:hypothetical protein